MQRKVLVIFLVIFFSHIFSSENSPNNRNNDPILDPIFNFNFDEDTTETITVSASDIDLDKVRKLNDGKSYIKHISVEKVETAIESGFIATDPIMRVIRNIPVIQGVT